MRSQSPKFPKCQRRAQGLRSNPLWRLRERRCQCCLSSFPARTGLAGTWWFHGATKIPSAGVPVGAATATTATNGVFQAHDRWRDRAKINDIQWSHSTTIIKILKHHEASRQASWSFKASIALFHLAPLPLAETLASTQLPQLCCSGASHPGPWVSLYQGAFQPTGAAGAANPGSLGPGSTGKLKLRSCYLVDFTFSRVNLRVSLQSLQYMTGWWFVTWILWLSISWECHNPNWLIFFRGVGDGSTTNQLSAIAIAILRQSNSSRFHSQPFHPLRQSLRFGHGLLWLVSGDRNIGGATGHRAAAGAEEGSGQWRGDLRNVKHGGSKLKKVRIHFRSP